MTLSESPVKTLESSVYFHNESCSLCSRPLFLQDDSDVCNTVNLFALIPTLMSHKFQGNQIANIAQHAFNSSEITVDPVALIKGRLKTKS